MSGLISILVVLLVLGVLLWGWQKIMAVLPIAEPFRTVIYVVVVCAIAIWLIYAIASMVGGIHLPTFR